MGTIRYDASKNRFLITAPPQQVGTVMRLPMRRFMQKLNVWIAPATRLNCETMLETMGAWEWDGGAREIAQSTQIHDEAKRAWPTWYKYGGPAPYRHQREAAALAYAYDEFFLSMEPGTAKTKVAIDVACAHRLHQYIESCVIICPLSVARTWEDELKTHCPLPYVVAQGSSKFTDIVVKPEQIGFVIFGVESFSQGKAAQVLLEWGHHHKFMLVMDESHYIKTHNSIRTKKIIEIGRQARVRLCLTGTQITKDLIDLYSQYEFLNTSIIGVGDFYAYRNRYAVMGGFKNKKVVGYDNVDELMGFLRPYTYSITKAECLDLPPKVYTRRYLDLDPAHRLMYDRLRGNQIEELPLKNVLVKMLRSRQLVGGFLPNEDGDSQMQVAPGKNAKLQALLAEVESISGSIIIFAQWLPEIGLIRKHLPEDQVLVFTGATDPDARQVMIHEFQAGSKRFFLSTIQAGGVGITLTAATAVLYYSCTDSYAARVQSEDRAHRSGLKHSVLYVDFIVNDSVEETLMAAYEAKQSLADFVRDQMEFGREVTL